MGKEMVLEAVEEVVEAGLGEEELVDRLYDILDTDTLPEQDGQDFEEYIFQLRKSIFIPSFGNPTAPEDMPEANQIAATIKEAVHGSTAAKGGSEAELKEEERPDPETSSGMTGVYGTQRQTIILIDWDGNVSFRERALFDEKGHPIQRGKGDMKFEFKIQGWKGESKGNEVHPLSVL
jgi:uncharacterized protein with NRDE domain